MTRFEVLYISKGSIVHVTTGGRLCRIAGALFAANMFLGVYNASSVQPVVSVERSVFYRERAAGMYSALPYAFAQVRPSD